MDPSIKIQETLKKISVHDFMYHAIITMLHMQDVAMSDHDFIFL